MSQEYLQSPETPRFERSHISEMKGCQYSTPMHESYGRVDKIQETEISESEEKIDCS